MTYQAQHLLLNSTPSFSLLAFIFFSTICSYNFHWYLTPNSAADSVRIKWAQQHKGWHLGLYFLGLAGSIIYFVPLRSYWPALAFGAVLTFLYSAPKLPQKYFQALRKIAIGKTVFLSAVWTYVTTILPLIIAGASWKPAYTCFVLSRLLLVYAICILFDYRDREDDKNAGIISIITFLGDRGIDRLFWITIGCFILVTIGFFFYNSSSLIVAILLIPGLLVAALHKTAKQKFSDYLYYFGLDGLMMFSGLLMIACRI